MDKLSDILQASLVTDPQGHLVTWRDEVIKCTKCDKDFKGKVATIDGVDGYQADVCFPCHQLEIIEERKAEAQEKANQVSEHQREVWWEVCNMPTSFSLKKLDDFDRKLQPKAFKVMEEYDWNWNNEKDTPAKSVVLSSPDLYGVGKTHLVCGLINKVIMTTQSARIHQDFWVQTLQCPVYFTTEPQMLDKIRATFKDGSGDTDEKIYERLIAYRLLVIDDVGKVRPRDLSFLQGVYYRIIDGRYTSGLPIILTTNLSFEELENHIGGACADRLREMCGDNFVKMAGKSYRRPKENK